MIAMRGCKARKSKSSMFKKLTRLQELEEKLAKGTHYAKVITCVRSVQVERTVRVELCSNISGSGAAVTLFLPKKDYDKKRFVKGEALTCYYPAGPICSALALIAVSDCCGNYYMQWDGKVNGYA